MRLPLAAGIGGTLLVALSAVLLWPEPAPEPKAPTPVAVRAPAPDASPRPQAAAVPQPRPAAAVTAAPRAVPAALPRPTGMQVQGVMARADAARSQALVHTQAAGAQLYRVGDTIADGWVLRRVAPDHVVVAQGQTEARLEVAGQAQAAGAAAQPPGTASAAASGAADRNIPPGLVRGPPPPVVSGTPEGNRRFLQDRRDRMAAAAGKQTP